MVNAVHTNLAGRGRFNVEGLKGSSGLKDWLEDKLVHQHGMLSASANIVTGNILVRFDPDKNHETVRNLIKHVISRMPGQDGDRPYTSPLELVKKETKTTEETMSQDDERLFALKQKVQRVLSPIHPQPIEKWHTLTVEQVQASVNSRLDLGITLKQVQNRIKRYGPNALPESKPRTRWEIFAGQFVSLPTALLGAAASVSLLTGGLLDAVIIMGVVVANAGIGYATESEAEKTIQSLKQAVHPSAQVIREGRVQKIPVENVVIGDLLVMKPGTYVGADSRIIQAERLSIDESALTGESMPVYKKPGALRLGNMPVADRVNMVFRGTLVTGGEGLAIVVSTGAYTEIGRLQMLLDNTLRPESPMERQLRVMGNQLVIISGGICGFVFVLGFLRGYGFSPDVAHGDIPGGSRRFPKDCPPPPPLILPWAFERCGSTMCWCDIFRPSKPSGPFKPSASIRPVPLPRTKWRW